jgi:hypothetical protein
VDIIQRRKKYAWKSMDWTFVLVEAKAKTTKENIKVNRRKKS